MNQLGQQSKNQEKNVFPNIDLNKQPKTELQALTASNSQFISIITHDLRQPFATVTGLLSLIDMNFKNGKPDETQEFIDLALKSTRRAMNLLDELSCWAIAQSKGKSFNPTQLKLYDLLIEEIEAVQVLCKQKKIAVEYHISSTLMVTADCKMVKAIVRNLITNAVKFTPEAGNITISAQNKETKVEVSVKDTGVGIVEKEQNELFNINVLHSTYGTNLEKGTGLGLQICKEFVDMHGGTMHLKSKPGEGSEFKFTLPLK